MLKLYFFLGAVLIFGLIAAGCTSTTTPAGTATPTAQSVDMTAKTPSATYTQTTSVSDTSKSAIMYVLPAYGLNDGATSSNSLNKIKVAVSLVPGSNADFDLRTTSLIFTPPNGASLTYSLGTASKNNQFFSVTLPTGAETPVTTMSLKEPQVNVAFYTGSANELTTGQKITVVMKPSTGTPISLSGTVPTINPSGVKMPFYAIK